MLRATIFFTSCVGVTSLIAYSCLLLFFCFWQDLAWVKWDGGGGGGVEIQQKKMCVQSCTENKIPANSPNASQWER